MLGFDRITFHPQVMGGRACIRGMRFTVSLILNLTANGMTPEEIVDAFPYLEPEDVSQALRYAASLAEERVLLAEPAASKAGAATYPERRGERERFLEAVEEGLADAEAGRVISDEELRACLDEELGPLEIGDLEKRLR
jgi:uncharacterized protein (DUF433 family)